MLPHGGTLKTLCLVKEASHTRTNIVMISCISVGKFIETESRMREIGGRGELLFLGHGVWGMRKFWKQSSDDCTTSWVYVMALNCVLINKMVSFVSCRVGHNEKCKEEEGGGEREEEEEKVGAKMKEEKPPPPL